jgi:hypothetical protein
VKDIESYGVEAKIVDDIMAGSFAIRQSKTGAILRRARVLVRFNHVASVIVNANHSIM